VAVEFEDVARQVVFVFGAVGARHGLGHEKGIRQSDHPEVGVLVVAVAHEAGCAVVADFDLGEKVLPNPEYLIYLIPFPINYVWLVEFVPTLYK
jgi:hypothetical protein